MPGQELSHENIGAAKEHINIEDALEKYGRLIWNCKGRSMQPLIREGIDYVVIEKPSGQIRPYDVVMYPRGAKYVLHRVIERSGDELVILGDNCVTFEHVPADRIIGVMTGLIRDGEPYDFDSARHRMYLDLWVRPRRLRVGLNRVRFKLKRVCAKATDSRRKKER